MCQGALMIADMPKCGDGLWNFGKHWSIQVTRAIKCTACFLILNLTWTSPFKNIETFSFFSVWIARYLNFWLERTDVGALRLRLVCDFPQSSFCREQWSLFNTLHVPSEPFLSRMVWAIAQITSTRSIPIIPYEIPCHALQKLHHTASLKISASSLFMLSYKWRKKSLRNIVYRLANLNRLIPLKTKIRKSLQNRNQHQAPGFQAELFASVAS